jgi:ribosome-interacting GTPase 1
MPANLPPKYFEAEKSYRAAKDPEEKIAWLQTMLSIMPKHKGTDKLHADLRRKIAKLSEEAERDRASGKRGAHYHIPKEGAGQVVLMGHPNAGKSQLMTAVTEASSIVADYPFTTLEPVPGMMKYENIQIQLIDTPPITSREAQPWFGNLSRSANLLVMVVDLLDEPVLQVDMIIEDLAGRRVTPVMPGQEGGAEPGETKRGTLIAANKIDVPGSAVGLEAVNSQYGAKFPVTTLSAKRGDRLGDFRALVFESLGILRVYTKTPGGKPDYEDPVILKRGSTLEDAAESVHKDFRAKLKYALVWGSGKYDGQRVSRDHVMRDGDIVELHI